MNPNYKEGLNFLVLDIELANPTPTSICQFAITEVQNGLLHKITHAYVNPETSDFSNTRFHGTSLEMVREKNPLKSHWALIKQLLEGKYVAAHNMDVEYNAFRLYAMEHQLELPEMKLMDTLNLNQILGIDNSGLKALGNYFSIEYFEHDALAESKAIAIAILKYCKAKNITDPYILYGSLGTIPHVIDDPAQLNKYEIQSTETVTEPAEKESGKIDLKGKLFVFTGELGKFERKDGIDKLSKLGGEIKNNVTLQTDYVVVGDKMDHKTAVLKTTEKYIEERGLPIQIITEDQFLEMVSG